MTEYKDVQTTEHEQGLEQRVATFKASQLIWLILGLIEALIALRIVFKLIGVNAANPFAALVYNLSNFFVAPFATLTGSPASAGMVLEVSSLIAMVIYLLIFWALERIVHVLFYRPRGPVSVRQTMVSDRTDRVANMGVDRSVTTNQTTTQVPLGTSQTTVTERTNTRTPDSL